MKILLDNVDLLSSSGPNHFAGKLYKYLKRRGNLLVDQAPDVQLSFIETHKAKVDCPLVQRLDGIYFNTDFNYTAQNNNIYKTYELAAGVVFQVNFAKDLVFNYFGEKSNYTIIPNGADVEEIESAKVFSDAHFDKYEDIWMSASSWRPHKRLNDNIKYFLEHASNKTALLVAGKVVNPINHPRIYYLGDLNIQQLYSLYKRSSTFVHLAWLDYCPNVVVDARAAGCQVVCSSTGGTREIAGPDAKVIVEDPWDFKPTRLYKPPAIKFDKIDTNFNFNSKIDMIDVAKEYENFLTSILKKGENK